MRRQPKYWNILPVTIREENGAEILRAWGIRPWDRDFGEELSFVGWQRVSLPEGWSIVLEEYDFMLLDQHGQIRARIRDFFPRTEPSPLMAAIAEGIRKANVSKKKEPRPPGPVLELATCVRKQSSFCLGDDGPYSYWVENAFGEELFGIHDVEVPQREVEEKLPQLVKQVDDWLAEHYPDWQNHLAYWDKFI